MTSNGRPLGGLAVVEIGANRQPMDTIPQFSSSSEIFFAAHKLLPVPEKTKMMSFLIILPLCFMAWYRVHIYRKHRLKN